MRGFIRGAALALVATLAGGAATAEICGEDGLCALGDRSYRVLAPEGWDGVEPLPVLVHFHGWGRTALNVVRNERITGPAAERRMLLVAPNGLGKSWSFWGNSLRDVEFLDAVVEDLATRAPIDRSRVILSGFSYGGAMVWRVACHRGGSYAGYLPIAGGLWSDHPNDCDGGPARVIHVHGLRDTVMRPPLGDTAATQDDMLLWRRANNCARAPDIEESLGRFDCRFWRRCDAGGEAGLCLIRGGHRIPRDWLSLALGRLLGQQGS